MSHLFRIKTNCNVLVLSKVITSSKHFHIQTSLNKIILGIETSCDDTGCAVINSNGEILGEALNSQNLIHLRYGGINPIIAHELHRNNIEDVVNEAIYRGKVTMNDVDSIAVTVKPGMLKNLQVGVRFANYLAKTFKKPLIPIHHMEAHALVARMYYDIPFPYLTLLISGGHCLLAIVKDFNKFFLLGSSLDNAPGEVMDKVARRMKLRNNPLYSQYCGGRAIEVASSQTKNPSMFEFPIPLKMNRDCNFSFSGLKTSLERKLIERELKHGCVADDVVPEVNELCAAFQLAIAEHIAHRTHRAIVFCDKNNFIPEPNKAIVVSGGVACNNFIFNSVKFIGEKLGYKTYRPPNKVCTDNGIMIAWNGLEKIRNNVDCVPYLHLSNVQPVFPLGENYVKHVQIANLPIRISRLKHLYNI